MISAAAARAADRIGRLRPTLPRRPTGLRARLVAAFTGVALLSSVGASGIAYHLVRRTMLQRTQDAALLQVKETLGRMVPPNLAEDAPVAAEIQHALARPPGYKAAVFNVPLQNASTFTFTFTGNPLDVPVSRRFQVAALTHTVFERVVSHGRPYLLIGARVYQGAGSAEATRIVAFVTVNLQHEAADLRTFTSAALTADALALAAALVLALVAARGVLRPVRRLGGAARALGEGRLDTRVEVHGGDELADLARTFNRTADRLEAMVGELSAMETAARRFVADVSHELRTPLTSMVAVTDLLAEEVSAEEVGASADRGIATRLVVEGTHRLRQLVEHLIEISRFDAGAATLVLDDVLVKEAIAATLSARGWCDQVAVAGPGDLTARLDPRRFDVIVANLTGNALTHGRSPVQIRFTSHTRDDTPGFELTVTDHGPGIPQDLLGLVFDRFVKADSARSRSAGSGLGLSIAMANTVLHGGTLRAANSTAGGAVFTLWLPTGQQV